MKSILLALLLSATSSLAFPGWTGCSQLPSDFHPTWGCSGRESLWNLWRNPFLFNYVYTALRTDSMPGIPDWNPHGGFWFIVHKSGLPFESYRGKLIEEYLGWKPDGTPGIALRRANSPGY